MGKSLKTLEYRYKKLEYQSLLAQWREYRLHKQLQAQLAQSNSWREYIQ